MSNSYLAANNFYSKIKTSTKRYDEIKSNSSTAHIIESNDIAFGNGSFLIKPNSSNYITKFIINDSKENVVLNLDIDTSMSMIGDIFTLMISINTSQQHVTLNLSDHFFLLVCGSHNRNIVINNERLVMKFIFDGEKFVNCNDIC